jgi:hypothetical protein
MRFDVKNLIKKRIYCIICKIFVSNMANMKCKNLIYLQLKFVKLFCKYVILAEHTVASHTYSKNFTNDAKQKYCNWFV